MGDLCFAYYCSGHGYGHATRVSALICHLFGLNTPFNIRVHIISSAPKHVFADSVALGAQYRYAEIDPIIKQPLAYIVDRKKSVDALRSFLNNKQAKLEIERKWLIDINANCVLSDAAFLGCLAAKAAGIPCILITNFTFDSVYSYLSTPITDFSLPVEHTALTTQSSHNFEDFLPDAPVPLRDLDPLVEQIHAGYRCADFLLLLPGYIPIPSFFLSPSLPSQEWVDPRTNKFYPDIIKCLSLSPSSNKLHQPIPFPSLCNLSSDRRQHRLRTVQLAPLLVRPLKATPSVYSPSGRARLLSSIGVPQNLQDPSLTKVLLVSFGGQIFRRPSSRQQSRPPTPSRFPSGRNSPDHNSESESVPSEISDTRRADYARPTDTYEAFPSSRDNTSTIPESSLPPTTSHRLVTPSHIWIPGAPPASKPISTPSPQRDCFPTISVTLESPTPLTTGEDGFFDRVQEEDEGARLLPDSSWIAIVCGVSKEQWNDLDSDSELPDGFFVAPRDVYMPDLTAIADVLLGKLGYGTVSECVDSCTPFVYVSRPLFIEEHGLRLLLDREGVGVELSRESYEAGDWATAVEEAWVNGREAKSRKRSIGEMGIELEKSNEQGQGIARTVVDWVQEWWSRAA